MGSVLDLALRRYLVIAKVQTQELTPVLLAYDANGNLTSDGVNTYVWDARDRLIGLSGGTTATFSYDALDRRLAKTINGATTTYLYDGADVVTEAGATNASYLSTLNIDEPLVRQTASGNEYYHTDDLGSTVALSDDSGSVTTRYTYGPFGETSATGATSGNPFQFTGRENDGTGLYYYRARYYSPSRSRFLSEDPLEFGAGDMNLYGYVFNNPTNLTDPSGKNPGCLIGGLAGTIGYNFSVIVQSLSGRKTSYYAGLDGLGRILAGNATAFGAGCAIGAGIGALSGGTTIQSSAYINTTIGRSIPNIATNVTPAQFQANLISNGYKVVSQTIGSNGPVTVLSNGQSTYTMYTATSTGGQTATLANAVGQQLVKIRLGLGL